MAVYFDTSVLIPLFFRESGSDAVLERVSQESEVMISNWTTAEFCSAAAFKVRRGDCDSEVVSQAVQKLFEMVNLGVLQQSDVSTEDFKTAGELCLDYQCGLRTPDALHGAIAQRLGTKLLTADQGLHHGCLHHHIETELVHFSETSKKAQP
ncbi:MAG: type II toxin-antitoxin system VapC family toxin [SAR324 cluster bacterium]|nr:type II toxin-antitoxin system VapC family toxin [SAR324 cluster bacterium]